MKVHILFKKKFKTNNGQNFNVVFISGNKCRTDLKHCVKGRINEIVAIVYVLVGCTLGEVNFR